MSAFSGGNWSIDLLPDWLGEADAHSSTISRAEGAGALQISSFAKDVAVTVDDLRYLANDHIEAGAKLADARAKEFQGFTFAFEVDDQFWQHWFFASSNIALVASYNCAADQRESEIADVRKMVASLVTT
jgi:hypothetical protein